MPFIQDFLYMLRGGWSANTLGNLQFKEGDLAIRKVTGNPKRAPEVFDALKSLLEDQRAQALAALRQVSTTQPHLTQLSDDKMAIQLGGFGVLSVALANSSVYAAEAMPPADIPQAAHWLSESPVYCVVSTLRPKAAAQTARLLYRRCPAEHRDSVVNSLERINKALAVAAVAAQ